MGPWEVMYVLMGVLLVSAVVLSLSLRTSKKNSTEMYGDRFEFGDPRCEQCHTIISENSNDICSCICHTQNNPHVKYHSMEIVN